ncbi:MAG: hypothetical protein ACFFBD_22400 [Candidatus Hodarchaeota archaeon]
MTQIKKLNRLKTAQELLQEEKTDEKLPSKVKGLTRILTFGECEDGTEAAPLTPNRMIFQRSPSTNRTKSRPPFYARRLVDYLRELLPKDVFFTNSWSHKTVWNHLQEAYEIWPKWRLVVSNRKKHQILLFERLRELPNPMPYSYVSQLATIIQCQVIEREPDKDRVSEGMEYHDSQEAKHRNRDLIEINMELLEDPIKLKRELAKGNVQFREHLISDPAVNLGGIPDHILLTEDGFVVREDKLSWHPWSECYLSAIFQLHTYAYILQALYPPLPCRALQICVHPRGGEICQVFTFPSAWNWFLPLFAHALLHRWGFPDYPECPFKCTRRGNCPKISPFPFSLQLEGVSRNEIDDLYRRGAKLSSS